MTEEKLDEAVTPLAMQFAYQCYAHQIEREDTLYQQRVNYSIVANGSILVFYSATLAAKFTFEIAKFGFLIAICIIGIGTTIMFERMIDRGYRYLQSVKIEFVERLGDYAASHWLPMPSMPREQYRDYPFSELTMYLLGMWFIVALVTVATIWGGISIEAMNG